MLSGIGQGRSFPSLSNATGRPAIVDSSTVEMTVNGCCPATKGALKDAEMSNLANPVDFFIVSTQCGVSLRPFSSDGVCRAYWLSTI